MMRPVRVDTEKPQKYMHHAPCGLPAIGEDPQCEDIWKRPPRSRSFVFRQEFSKTIRPSVEGFEPSKSLLAAVWITTEEFKTLGACCAWSGAETANKELNAPCRLLEAIVGENLCIQSACFVLNKDTSM